MKFLIALFLLVSTTTIYANNCIKDDDDFDKNLKEVETISVSDNLLSLSILPTGLFYERGFGNKHTLNLQALLGYSLFVQANEHNSLPGMTNATFVMLPQFLAGYRFYYNLEKRSNNSKSIYGNSGNYFTVLSKIDYNPIIISNKNVRIYNYEFVFGAAWGLHRTYKRNIDIDFNIGLGYSYNDIQKSGVSPILNFRFGYVLIPKKQKL